MILKIIQIVASLAFVLSLIGIVSILLRKFENKAEIKIGKKRLRILESLNLGGNKRIFIIEQDGVEHLIGTSEKNISMLETNISNNILEGSITKNIKPKVNSKQTKKND